MRMPSHDIRNDGIGPYAVFYCEKCSREYRSSPSIGTTVTQSVGRQAIGGLLRKVPLVGGVAADRVTNEDYRYVRDMRPEQLEKAWEQVQGNFNECPLCKLVVCHVDWDPQTGYCKECTPRKDEMAEAEGAQAASMIKGIASAFGIPQAIQNAAQQARAQQAAPAAAPAPAAGGATCPKCGVAVAGKFCPECGTKVEVAPAKCPQCGAEAKGAKFCPECGTKIQ